MIVTSVQIKTAKTQKHLYCPVFTHRRRKLHIACGGFLFYKLPRLQFFITSRFRVS